MHLSWDELYEIGRDGSYEVGGDGPYENGTRAGALPGAVWRKAQASNPNGECVELAGLPDGSIAVRNSRFPGGPALVYTRGEMAAFIRGAKDGDFDDLLADRRLGPGER